MVNATQFPKLLRPKEVREILAIGANKLMDLRKSGELPAIRVGSEYRYDPERLMLFIEANSTTPDALQHINRLKNTTRSAKSQMKSGD